MRTHHRQPRMAALPALAADSLALQMTVAADAVAAVREGYALNDGLAGLWSAHPALPASARPGVQDMVYGCLRDYGRGERMLHKLLQQPLTAMQVDGLLRVALHRLETRADIAHTVVDQAVEAAARMVGGGLKGLVNAVLRNALRQWDALVAECDRDEVAHYRHPQWWLAALKRHYPNNWQAIADAGNQRSPMSLRVNRRRSTLAAAQAELAADGHLSQVLGDDPAQAWALRLDKAVPVASLPGIAAGRLSVQDWGAQQAAMLLDVQDGQRVLDACSAPGGKAAHMLEIADLDLLALDADAGRVARVASQLDRLGLSARVVAADARDRDRWWDGRPFDRILADVPCSASGVVRRHPDIKWLRQREDIARFATLQAEILDALWPSLAAGGKMLYVSCSVFPDENSLQVERFVARHPDCLRLPMPDGALERQYLPDPDHDGFYFALLAKSN